MKPPCERDCPRRTAECHTKCLMYLTYQAEKQAEYRANWAERDRNAYTADAEKRCKSVERQRKAGLL